MQRMHSGLIDSVYRGFAKINAICQTKSLKAQIEKTSRPTIGIMGKLQNIEEHWAPELSQSHEQWAVQAFQEQKTL